MFNTDLPRRADLPTSEQLARSTRKALLAASAILVFLVMPAEYGIDPTRVGGLLGLTEMGEIKQQLAAEAAADAATLAAVPVAAPAIDQAMLTREVERAVAAALAAREAPAPAAPIEAETVAEGISVAPLVEQVAAPLPRGSAVRSDEMAITLTPGEGAEVKLVMSAGDIADFSWTVDGGVANFDLHGDGGGQNVTYEQGRGIAADDGNLEAAFDGNHGWFWRNRGDEPITVILRTQGAYDEIKRVS